jgi:hypothetical protein
MAEEALRLNEGKTRYDLLTPGPIEELAKVLTLGAQKYAPRNWEKGMSWSKVIASYKRHLAEFEKCEDFDKETGLKHLAHAMCNIHFLIEYYKTHPEYDDRPKAYLEHKKVGIDIDDVICDFTGGWAKKYGCEVPQHWNFSYDMWREFDEMIKTGEITDFFLGLEPLIKPCDLPFEPYCYITSRSIDPSITKDWIDGCGFPTTKLYVVPFNTSKVKVALESGIDYFIDDKFENFVELNKAGICTFLYDRPHNKRYNVGYKRIISFQDFKDRFL